MPVNSVPYASVIADAAQRGPSAGVWGDCPWDTLHSDPNYGTCFWDDFTDTPLPPGTLTTEIGFGKYKVYSGGTVAVVSAVASTETPGGIIRFLCDTDNDLTALGTVSCPFMFKTTKLWFEARIATTSILTAMGQLFVGLAENDTMTYGAGVPLATGDATTATGAMIGFNRLEDGLAVVNTSYADHAATWMNVKASAYTALAANTFVKLGMTYDPSDPAKAIKFFVNGVELADGVTQAVLTAMTYLDAVGVGPCIAFQADTSGTSDYVYLDWWRGAQLAM